MEVFFLQLSRFLGVHLSSLQLTKLKYDLCNAFPLIPDKFYRIMAFVLFNMNNAIDLYNNKQINNKNESELEDEY